MSTTTSAGSWKQGETVTLTTTVQNSGAAVDLSGLTSGLEFALRGLGESTNELDFDGSASTANGSSISGNDAGVLTVVLSEAETAALDVGVYQFQIWVDDGTSRDMVSERRLTIELGYT